MDDLSDKDRQILGMPTTEKPPLPGINYAEPTTNSEISADFFPETSSGKGAAGALAGGTALATYLMNKKGGEIVKKQELALNNKKVEQSVKRENEAIERKKKKQALADKLSATKKKQSESAIASWQKRKQEAENKKVEQSVAREKAAIEAAAAKKRVAADKKRAEAAAKAAETKKMNKWATENAIEIKKSGRPAADLYEDFMRFVNKGKGKTAFRFFKNLK